MKQDMILYHGSQQIVETPIYGKDRIHNDYGRGFYCTEDKEMAKEWACSVRNDGYCNKYVLHLDSLNVMHLTKGSYNILNWLAILLQKRRFDIISAIGKEARDFIISRFLPDLSDVDVVTGYRADDSYFSFAEDFVNNSISLRELNRAMQLGKLGEQVVLLSERAFEQIEFKGYEIADYREYYYRRLERDRKAKSDYLNQKRIPGLLRDDLFILDIIREDMKNDDKRLQSVISR